MENKSLWDIKFRIKHANIAIIGGGIIGCFIAKLLSESSLGNESIYVFEKGLIGSGASSKNDGQILMNSSEHYNRLCNNLGRENAKRIMEFKLQSVQKIYEYERKIGSLTWAYNQTEKNDLLESYELLQEDKFPVTLIQNPQRIKEWSGSRAFKLGLYFPLDKSLDPLKYVYSIKKQAQKNGVEFITDKNISKIEDGEFLIDDYGNKIRFDICIIATNWAALDLVPKLKDKIWGVRGQMVATEGVNLSGQFTNYCHQTKQGYNYWKFYKNPVVPAEQRLPQFVIGGERTADESTEETDQIGSNGKIQKAILKFIKDSWGVDTKIKYHWSGIMGNTKDGFPIVGSLSNMPNVILAIGGNGYGMSYSWGIADSVKKILLNGQYPLMDMLGTKRFQL